MPGNADQILATLDACCASFTFPMLDNGYVYLAASRLSLHVSPTDWALVIEIFGFSPRSGLPDVHVHTFASSLHARDPRERFVSLEAYQRYLENNPNNESRFFYPCDDQWLDQDNGELVSEHATFVTVRGHRVQLPALDDYGANGIRLEAPHQARTYELCRWLAATHRNLVLATPTERLVSVPPDLTQILELEEWRHPDLLAGELPSTADTFRALAEVLVTGDVSRYRAVDPPNTHWSNWPAGGTL